MGRFGTSSTGHRKHTQPEQEKKEKFTVQIMKKEEVKQDGTKQAKQDQSSLMVQSKVSRKYLCFTLTMVEKESPRKRAG